LWLGWLGIRGRPLGAGATIGGWRSLRCGNGGLDGEVGSTAHGTGIAGGEDHDQLAVVVETPDGDAANPA
jgi:hypothetical protein